LRIKRVKSGTYKFIYFPFLRIGKQGRLLTFSAINMYLRFVKLLSDTVCDGGNSSFHIYKNWHIAVSLHKTGFSNGTTAPVYIPLFYREQELARCYKF
jgi:hypothetical protein